MMELVLVCAILMAVAAVGVPVMMGMMSGSKLDEAKDAVQAVLTQGRTQAIREGRAYRLEVKDNSGQYRLIVDDEMNPMANEQQEPTVPEVQTLPDSVFFCCSSGAAFGSGGDWTSVVVFQADGTGVDDSTIRFRTQKSLAVVVEFRAATGRAETIGWEGDEDPMISSRS